MKNLLKKIRMKQRASQIRKKSVDPLKAHKGQVEITIYTWLLDVIEKELQKELEKEQAVIEPTVPTAQKVG